MSGLVGPDGVTPASSRDCEVFAERPIGPIMMPIPRPAADLEPEEYAQGWLDMSKHSTATGDNGMVLVATLMALWSATSMALASAEARLDVLEKRVTEHEGPKSPPPDFITGDGGAG